ncbi:hypothetical protein [Kutzneria chonburiensis]|uniref:FxLD family lantipeptide n=1 Tax=Kutzneria chonburiensis TaxID=1483604 RepID=A0ABV6N795_9PSEU|nr:hypothetical protein [Kutzneria chonburiensis]
MTALLDDFDLDIRIGDRLATTTPDASPDTSKCPTEASGCSFCGTTEITCTTGSGNRTVCC